MAHIRKDSSRPTTTVSWDNELLLLIEDYRFSKRKDTRSMAINELVKYGLKYVELVEKKKAKKSMSS